MASRPEDPRATEREERRAEGANGRHRSRGADAPRHVRREPEAIERVVTDGNGSAIASMVLGMLGLTLAFLVFPAPAAVVMGIAAILLGIVGMRNAGRLGGLHKGLSVTGLVTGVLALLLGGAVIIGGIAVLDDLRERIDVEDIQVPDNQ